MPIGFKGLVPGSLTKLPFCAQSLGYMPPSIRRNSTAQSACIGKAQTIFRMRWSPGSTVFPGNPETGAIDDLRHSAAAESRCGTAVRQKPPIRFSKLIVS